MTTEWKVLLNGVQIDTVFFGNNTSAEEVRQGLIKHDSYPENIRVEPEESLQQEVFDPHNTINS